MESNGRVDGGLRGYIKRIGLTLNLLSLTSFPFTLSIVFRHVSRTLIGFND